MTVYDFSTLRIHTTHLAVKPREVFKKEAVKEPQKRAQVICLWLSYLDIDLDEKSFDRVHDWVNDFLDCRGPGSELVKKFSYAPRLGVVAAQMPETLLHTLVDKQVYVATAESLAHLDMAADGLRHMLCTKYHSLCHRTSDDYSAGLRKYMRKNIAIGEIKGAPIEEVIVQQYPESEQEEYRHALHELMIPYKKWSEVINLEPWQIAP